MSKLTAQEFIIKYSMQAERIDPLKMAEAMLTDMKQGLAGEKSDMPMIPAYLSNDASIPLGKTVAVIDAGGTNFRSALVHFDNKGCHVSKLRKAKMPGTDEPCTWDEFISFVADSIEPLLSEAESIGFCFSYSAEILPNMDAKVLRIDKEVVIQNSEDKLIAASLTAELERRGIYGKKVVILNDTVAVLLGGAAELDKSAYSGFVGQVSGTGTNTCVSLPEKCIPKLHSDRERGMIINIESGLFAGEHGGDFDRILDFRSNNPSSKLFEKLTAGEYLGNLCKMMLSNAAYEGYISRKAGECLRSLGSIDSAIIDAWSVGARGELLGGDENDVRFAAELSRNIFIRSARCMCANLLALQKLTGAGLTPEKPLCVIAEGSLVQKSKHYRPELERLLKKYSDELGVYIELRLGNDTTLSGAAAAALLNS